MSNVNGTSLHSICSSRKLSRRSKLKDNFAKGDRKALKTLKNDKEITLKKADKGTIVVMDK